ncbi:hypothetical protein BN381_150057 [Candidatus Microthrix parvicella RN1]|uniref:Uncharacterized protein n=1 Tax=Candidatus Neomicrothrix parvicella RN1 TaxID=1229780 RepID=R4YX76_9ACTN|nr:hypothetical protein BN381_150057 [Candidatus Microthrix parvicella RN1]
MGTCWQVRRVRCLSGATNRRDERHEVDPPTRLDNEALKFYPAFRYQEVVVAGTGGHASWETNPPASQTATNKEPPPCQKP